MIWVAVSILKPDVIIIERMVLLYQIGREGGTVIIVSCGSCCWAYDIVIRRMVIFRTI